MHEEICDRGARESVCVRAKIAVGEGEVAGLAGDFAFPSKGEENSPLGSGAVSTLLHSTGAPGPAVSGAIRGQTTLVN